MTSKRQIVANRRNAKHSTGPRSLSGKTRASKNAVRHGLAISLAYDPKMWKEVRDLAKALSADGHRQANFEHAAIIAETTLDLLRIRTARASLHEQMLAANATGASLDQMGHLARIDRYERRALSRRKRAARQFV